MTMRESKTDGGEGRSVVKNQIFLSTLISCHPVIGWLNQKGLGVIVVIV